MHKQKADYLAHAYTYPYFQQTWTLFTPPPTGNYRLLAEYEKNGTQKTDIFEEVLTSHQTNRLAGKEPLLLALANSIYYVEHDPAYQQKLNGPITGNINFKLLAHLALNYLSHKNQSAITNLKLTLVVTDINTKQERVYFN